MKVETEIKEKVNRVTKIERVDKKYHETIIMKNKFTKQLFVSITLIFSLLLSQSCQTESDENINLQPESKKVSLSEKVDSETRETLNISKIKSLNENNPISLGLINEIKKITLR